MLTNNLHQQLEEKNIKLERFQEISSRLFASGIIIRDDEGVEQRLYDDARRIDDILTETFSLFGFRLVHDSKNEFYRLFAPGAAIPGIPDDGKDPVSSLRMRLSADFVAAALALRFMYQQGLSEGGGRLTDRGEVLIKFEELSATMQTQLKRALPELTSERRQLLQDLKRHRIIRISTDFSIEDEDAWIAIRSVILGMISNETLANALEKEDPIEEEVPENEDSK